jgi:predicted metal-dependent enzyme (double-stranded beta helix superfamily)
MPYTLEQFCDEARDILKADGGDDGRENIRRNLEKLLANPEFVAANCGPAAERGIHTLFHDAETDFHVLAHIYENGTESPPHDHGPSWAIYGQAILNTDMTIWERKDDGAEDGHAVVEPAESYTLEPGMVGVFHPGQIHSIKFPSGARFVRVTGTDLNTVAQARYDLKSNKVSVDDPMAHAR